jgi:hypothetical protein
LNSDGCRWFLRSEGVLVHVQEEGLGVHGVLNSDGCRRFPRSEGVLVCLGKHVKSNGLQVVNIVGTHEHLLNTQHGLYWNALKIMIPVNSISRRQIGHIYSHMYSSSPNNPQPNTIMVSTVWTRRRVIEKKEKENNRLTVKTSPWISTRVLLLKRNEEIVQCTFDSNAPPYRRDK